MIFIPALFIPPVVKIHHSIYCPPICFYPVMQETINLGFRKGLKIIVFLYFLYWKSAIINVDGRVWVVLESFSLLLL